MELTSTLLPKLVPLQPYRPPQKNIPQTKTERDRLRYIIERYVEEKNPVPPLSLQELREHAERVVEIANVDTLYRDYVAVLIDNQTWKETLAAIPYQRRLLLLPKCLRVEDKCPAPFDEFGLLCKRCGLCSIQDLQDEAERLGYAVLVAEGSAIVMALIETGKIDAIVGVSCLSVLERAFPYMEAAAIPGIAIPLLQDDCADTTVDLDWVWDIIHLTSHDRTRRLDLDSIRKEVDSWFTSGSLAEIMGRPQSSTERLAQAWLGKAGKRWRPFLTVCAYQALQADPAEPFPDGLRKAAAAVECFHKASLVHDDIEDGDALRYGEQTLHEEFGVPVALNVGDYLVGEGYRLLSHSGASPECTAEMIRTAVAGHRSLCIGQGEELWWLRHPQPLSSLQVLDIFRRKTAPAFEVALRLGALYAGAGSELWEVLERYSQSLGIAYQIRDDLDDCARPEPGSVIRTRPSLLYSVAWERTRPEQKALLEKLWCSAPESEPVDLAKLFSDCGAEERVRRLLESYKEEAINALRTLENASLKGLLRRVIGKIFSDLEIKGWCSEFETRNVAGGETGSSSPA